MNDTPPAHAGHRQYLDRASLDRFAVACGLSVGDMPALGHWAWFCETPADATLGADGHPLGGEIAAPPGYPRRMFAGAEIAFHAPLAPEREAVLHSRLVDMAFREGRGGPLAIAHLARRIEQDGRTCITEDRRIVYRAPGPAMALPPERNTGDWRPDPIALFRFSAATFNSHRIHYDLPYAMAEEGYPERVVHGPFTAAQLAEGARKALGRPLTRFGFRALAPLFCGQPVALRWHGAQGVATATRCDDVLAMKAEFA